MWKFKMTRRKKIRLALVLLISLPLCYFVLNGDAWRTASLLVRITRGKPEIVTLSADPAKAGRIHGSKLKFGVRLLEKFYVGRLEQPGLTEKARDLFAGIDPRWTTELAALADSSGADRDALMLGNCFLDLGRFRGGCRQVLAVRSDGSVLHAHNLDWNLSGVGQFWVSVFRVPGGNGRLATVYFGFPGMVGALDVINSEGVALSFNQLGYPKQESKMPVFLEMRNIAETCPDFESAEAALLSMPPGMPFCIGLSHSKSGKIAVYERNAAGVVSKREPQAGLITADNTPRADRPPQENALDEAACAALPLDTGSEVAAILRNRRVLLGCNLYSVIFDFKANVFYLASGSIPAAEGEYRAYPLF